MSNVLVEGQIVDNLEEDDTTSGQFPVNPLMRTNGLSHPYHLDESAFIFRGIGSNFYFLFR